MSTGTRRTVRVLLALVLVVLAIWRIGDRVGEQDGATPGSPSASSTTAASTTASAGAPSGGGGLPSSSSGRTPDSGLPTIPVSRLPAEGRETLARVEAGGPYPYARDGVVFNNRERLLPRRARGYYAEYTVPTPGEDDRGARRLVVGDGGDVYYTDDHYASFRQVGEGR